VTEREIEEAARAMYDARPSRPHCPSWDQLGETTKSVWREYVLAEAFGDLA